MNHVEEILQAIFIGLAVVNFLLNIGCALKAMELSKETLVLLNDRTLSIEKQIGQIIINGSLLPCLRPAAVLAIT